MIDTGAGVIDADYRGIVFVLLFNLSDKDFQGSYLSTRFVYSDLNRCSIVEEGDRIAQLIIERIYTPDVLEVDVSLLSFPSGICNDDEVMHQDLDQTIRGAGGFGSTGGHNLLNAAPSAS